MTAAKMTPQQALGEALACLQRAQTLLKVAAEGLEPVAKDAAERACGDLGMAWPWIQRAKAQAERTK